MTKTYLEVQQQIAKLQQQAEQLRLKEADGVLKRIKEAIAVYGFTASDLGFEPRRAQTVKAGRGASAKPKKPTHSAPPKFKDDAGHTWSGRGPRPGWFKEALAAGKTSQDLAA